jgi:hypothetical protein
MKITRQQNGSCTVGFEGCFGIRQAIGLKQLLALFPQRAPVTLDFTRARWDDDVAVAALIPAIASLHRAALKIVGLTPSPA